MRFFFPHTHTVKKKKKKLRGIFPSLREMHVCAICGFVVCLQAKLESLEMDEGGGEVRNGSQSKRFLSESLAGETGFKGPETCRAVKHCAASVIKLSLKSRLPSDC